MTKRCLGECGATLPLSAFYAMAKMADGHLNQCKECVKRRVRGRAAREPEKLAAYERERLDRPERRRAQRSTAAAAKKRDPERFARYQREYVERYPERRKARVMVGNAVRDGRLKKMPCGGCGSKRSQAHHDDYSKPLEVRWLCSRCHGLEHRSAR